MWAPEGGTQVKGMKTKSALPTGKNPAARKGRDACKPFAGKVFYLDLTSKLISEKLEKDIKELGGAVEGFLSKEISYLITNKKEAKCAKTLRLMCLSPRPETAQNTGSSSACASNRIMCHASISRKKAEKGLVSRGKSLVTKAIKEQEFLPKNSILYNAWNWGVKILHVEEAKAYIEQKRKTLEPAKKMPTSDKPKRKLPVRRKAKRYKLTMPYIKVEDSDCKYKPQCLMVPYFRYFEQYITENNGPINENKKLKDDFMQLGPIISNNPTLNMLYGMKHTSHQTNHPPIKGQKKNGYCECCLKKYEDLEAHVATSTHRTFSESNHYEDVDNLISLLDFDFVDWSKCSEQKRSHSVNVSMVPAESRLNELERNQVKKLTSPNKHTLERVENIPLKIHLSPLRTQISTCTCQTVCYANTAYPVLNPPASSTLCNQNCTADSFSKNPITNPNESSPKKQHVCKNSEERNFELELCDIPVDDLHSDIPELGGNFGKDLQVYAKCSPKLQHVCKNSEERNVELELCDIPADDLHSDIPELGGNFGKDLQQSPGFETLNSNISTENSYMWTVSGLPLKVSQENNGESEKATTPPSNLHRKVRHLCRKNRNAYAYNPVQMFKTSVGQVTNMHSSPKESMLDLFRSSEEKSAFLGFSEKSLCRMKEYNLEPSHGNQLWSLFTDTSGSASSFAGF